MHPLIEGTNTRKFLLGNEAIVRGALESGLRVGAAYPGTPSSEIGNHLFKIQEELPGLYFEFTVNEKVAMEFVGAASACGLRALTCMKHVGLNVASDAFMTLGYIGVKGGLVVVTADDPSCHSSQNEQDNRYYARLAHIPLLEAYSPQSAYELIKIAFELSEELEVPVILRTTTRVSHARGIVKVGEIPYEIYKNFKQGFFEKNPLRYVPVPAVARERHRVLLQKLKKAQEIAETFPQNQMLIKGKFGICTSGVALNYVLDAVQELEAAEEVSLLLLTFVHPFPERLAKEFLTQVESCLVVEELEPYLEDFLRITAYNYGLKTKILGKREGFFPRHFEFSTFQVKKAIAEYLGKKVSFEIPPFDFSSKLPQRPPVLCLGCPHRETYKVIKEVLQELGKEENTIYPTDIGCYTLAILPPLKMADYLLCMGSSVGSSCGFDVATSQEIVAFIGDSTFFHSGISPLVNAKYYNHNFTLVVLDNETTAMTGHQPVPSQTLKLSNLLKDKPIIPIKEIVEALKIPCVEINPYKKEEAKSLIKPLFEKKGVKVIVAKAPCILYKSKFSK